MTAFFDATNTADTALVVRPLRTHDELVTVAAQAERDVIGIYTRRGAPVADFVNNFYTGRGYHKGNGVWVAIEGFDPDASAVTNADLVRALKDTIADVITWRLRKMGENPVFESVSTAIGISKTTRDSINDPFPPGEWDFRLKPYDLRQPVYTI